jgi:16S rRNA (guanine527-N7)-methyltransferase
VSLDRGDAELTRLLEEAQDLGFIGPGPLEDHVEHALGFARILSRRRRTRVLDLGSGGGLPGLVVARHLPGVELALLDSSARRTDFLGRAVARLGLSGRVAVLRRRAEPAGHEGGLRAGFDAVVTRGFGPPAVTAECASPFLRLGGLLVVSEPPVPATDERWPPGPLGQLGLAPRERLAHPHHFQILEQVDRCPDRFARREGVPSKRPLF